MCLATSMHTLTALRYLAAAFDFMKVATLVSMDTLGSTWVDEEVATQQQEKIRSSPSYHVAL